MNFVVFLSSFFSFFLTQSAHANPPTLERPSWAYETLGQISVDGNPIENPLEQTLLGQDIYTKISPLSFESFKLFFKSKLSEADLPAAYQDYLNKSFNHAIASELLRRYLDSKIIEKKIPLQISEVRLNYAARFILSQEADTRDLYYPEEISYLSSEDLFQSVKNSIKEFPFQTKVRWDAQTYGLKNSQQILTSHNELTWGDEFPLQWSELPETYQEFKAQLRTKLEKAHKILIRSAVFQAHILRNHSNLELELKLTPESDRIQKQLDIIQDTTLRIFNRITLESLSQSIANNSPKHWNQSLFPSVSSSTAEKKIDPKDAMNLSLAALEEVLAADKIEASTNPEIITPGDLDPETRTEIIKIIKENVKRNGYDLEKDDPNTPYQPLEPIARDQTKDLEKDFSLKDKTKKGLNFLKEGAIIYLKDIRDMVISPVAGPLKWGPKEWIIAAAVAGLTTGLIYGPDDQIRDFFQNHKNKVTDTLSWPFANYGVFAGGMSAFFIVGFISKDQKFKKTVLLAMESVIINNIIRLSVTGLFGRERPSIAANSKDFAGPSAKFDNGSFPSGHVAAMVSVAAVVADQYSDSAWIPWVAYSLGIATALSRLNDNFHWASDIVIGAAFGWATAKAVIKLDFLRNKKNLGIIPFFNGSGYGLAVRYEW